MHKLRVLLQAAKLPIPQALFDMAATLTITITIVHAQDCSSGDSSWKMLKLKAHRFLICPQPQTFMESFAGFDHVELIEPAYHMAVPGKAITLPRLRFP